MNKFFIIFLFVFLLLNISATCNENQIDINSASAEELDEIINVGPATAEKIIANRTYNSVADLIKVKGIGEVTLAEIKEQGLACVEEEIEENNKEESKEDESNNLEELINKENLEIEETSDSQIEKVNLTPISLNTKNIKSEDNKEILKRNLSFYGIITICLIFGALLILKNRKRKNEFN